MKHRHLITGFFLSLCLLLTSCASNTQRETTEHLPAATYLKLAATAKGQSKQSYLISAADRLIQDRQLTRADQVLSSIDTDLLSPELQTRYQLTQASFYLLHHQNRRALQLLNQIQSQQSLDTRQQFKLNKMYVLAYQSQGNTLQVINYYNNMLNLSTDDAQRQDTLLQTWDYLQTLPTAQLLKLSASSENFSTLQQGWLQLILIANNSEPNQSIQNALTQWRQQYPSHPANALLPSTFSQSLPQASKQVALLLPLTGPLGSKGTAIRNGFFAAYYADKKNNPNTPNVKVIDSTSGPISDIYQQAIAQGADFVVGPLTKDNVKKLSAMSQLPVRTLALNSLIQPTDNQPLLYQFGLSPIDEVSQVIHKAWQENHTRAIVITPNNSWGDGINQAFSQQWQQRGGVIVDSLRFSNLSNLSTQIRSLLNINLAQQRYQQLKNTVRSKLRFVPYRRQDVDMIFLAAQPNTARQIRPLLKYYYAGNVPVYALSTIYSGTANTRLDRDLNGIIFCDMPWVLNPYKMLSPSLLQIRGTIKQLWPHSYQSNIKLYALGVDAYRLVGSLTKLSLLPKFGISGATGRLYLDSNQHIYRRLLWAQMNNSQPTLQH